MTSQTAANTRHRGSASLAGKLVLTVAFACAAPGAFAQDPDARALLASMSNYIAGQQNIDLTFDSDIEVVTTEDEKLQFTNSGGAQLSRPNRLHAWRTGGYSDVELFFDGRTVAIHGKNANSYAQFEAAGDVDALITALRAGHGIALPAADLLLTNAFDVLIADVQEAKYIGRGVVGGVECEHLAFRNADTDWQLWVDVGATPIPRKMVITSKSIPGSPQYTVRVTSWKTGGSPAAATFAFAPTAGMTPLKPDGLLDLDELPQDTAPGEVE